MMISTVFTVLTHNEAIYFMSHFEASDRRDKDLFIVGKTSF